jgi:hypothetical protein
LWTALGLATVEAARTTFARQLGVRAARLAETLGSPNTWPASWLFAWKQGRSPGQYDLLVGRYLFYRQQNLDGVVEVGEGDEALLAEGWGPLVDMGEEGAASWRKRLASSPLSTAGGPGLLAGGQAQACRTTVGVGSMAGLATADRGTFRRRPLRLPRPSGSARLNDVVLDPGA